MRTDPQLISVNQVPETERFFGCLNMGIALGCALPLLVCLLGIAAIIVVVLWDESPLISILVWGTFLISSSILLWASLRKKGMSSDARTIRINNFLQSQLKMRNLSAVDVVEAAKWLDARGILKDSHDRPGQPLRRYLRRGVILGQRQELNKRWYIDRV